MPKVLLHNLTIQYNQADSGIFHNDQNAVFFAEDGDIVITRAKIPKEYLLFLNEIGIKNSGVEFFYSSKKLDGPTSIFEDQNLLDRVRHRIGGNARYWIFDVYIFTEWEAQWARKLRLVSNGNPSLLRSFGNKSEFRRIAKKYGFSVPFGFEFLDNTIDGAIAAAHLFLKGFREVVVKQDEGAAGLGSLRFSRNKFLSYFFRLDQLFPKASGWGIKPAHSHCFVVEGWHSDTTLSPSVQFYIDSSGEPELLSMHCQLFYENKMTYRGCLSYHWIPEELQFKLRVESSAFARTLATEGLRGHFSLNAILFGDGRVLWTEVNARRVSSSYPFQIVRRLERRSVSSFLYASTRMRKSAWRGKSPGSLLAEFSSVLFSPRTGRGVIPYDFGRLQNLGELYILAVGKNKEEINELFRYVISY